MKPTLLVSFPHAGAGPSFFAGWWNLASPGLDVAPVGLPGREKRFGEEPLEYVSDAVEDALPQIRAQAGGYRGVCLFGHSLGAVLAYETACRLVTDADVPVVGLVVSGSAGPAHRHDLGATGLPEDAFLDAVERATGYRHEALDDPDLRELLLPALRADIAMHERYRSTGRTVLDVPVLAVRGAEDHLIDAQLLGQWREVTTAGFEARSLPGGHMYLAESPGPLLCLIGDSLERALPPDTPGA
ncbi:thioesterase II family protein [Streptomyces scabiei]|uniref:thioesterase II family protein n=1 Tax=Streptomyces scabiei TaxID=1930 RepID=UPI000690135C|nr:alpha/beta fold hydrolase [Streptomyces scabiei]